MDRQICRDGHQGTLVPSPFKNTVLVIHQTLLVAKYIGHTINRILEASVRDFYVCIYFLG